MHPKFAKRQKGAALIHGRRESLPPEMLREERLPDEQRSAVTALTDRVWDFSDAAIMARIRAYMRNKQR